jgi:hypothetical protein
MRDKIEKIKQLDWDINQIKKIVKIKQEILKKGGRSGITFDFEDGNHIYANYDIAVEIVAYIIPLLESLLKRKEAELNELIK